MSAHNVREPGSVVAHDFNVYADTATAFEADDEIKTFVPIAMLLVAPAVLLSPPATIEDEPSAVCRRVRVQALFWVYCYAS